MMEEFQFFSSGRNLVMRRLEQFKVKTQLISLIFGSQEKPNGINR